MGNIRQIAIKNIALLLLEKYPERFVPGDFQHNKASVGELIDTKSKLLRNRIAGYVTKRVSSQKKHGVL